MQNMGDKKLISIFDSQNDVIFQDKIWEKCSSIDYKNEVIELKFDCSRYSHSQKKFKAITLWLGEQTLYSIKNDKPNGMLSLTFATLTSQSIEGEEVIRLEKNKQIVDLVVQNHEQLFELLQKKCIVRTFHSDYSVQKQIGKGNFANVFLATHKHNGISFAVKDFKKEQILREIKGKESLKNEIKIMRSLNQENLLHLHEVHETENSVYFIMDLLEGGELLQKIQSTIFSAKSLQQLMFKLLKALQYMHQKNCMHRDLKPQNILFKSSLNDTDIVIADFGLAMFMEVQPLFKRCGTPGFVAPEILQFQTDFEFYDQKCDIFSAGAIFYMLLTGNCPFYGENATQVLLMNKECQINFNVRAFEKAPDELKQLLKNMLKSNPNERYSADQCLHHPYFQEIFNSQEILEYRETKKQQFLINGIQQINHDDSQQGSLELITKEIQWNGKIETVESFASISNENSPNQFEKKQTQLSRFGKFSRDLAEYYANSKLSKHSNKESLHKTALRNAQRNKIQSKDDDYIPEEYIPEMDQKIKLLKRQMPKGGYFQKSNTCDFQN